VAKGSNRFVEKDSSVWHKVSKELNEMKKLMAVLLTVSLGLIMIGCGEKPAPKKQPPKPPTKKEVPEKPSEKPAPEKPAPKGG